MKFLVSLLIIEALCLVGVTADYYLKMAGSGQEYIRLKLFLIGLILQASTAIGWFLVMKHLTLVQIGVYYSISNILMLAALGVFGFNETIGTREISGIILAIISIALMARFS